MTDEFYPLTPAIVRNLIDKLYEKRKSAAIEIEKLVRLYFNHGKEEEIRLIIRHCGENFCTSSSCHYRKGGSIGLAAVAISLGKNADKYCSDIICPSIKLLQDTDSRVRYYACESLYNCIKVLEANVMPHFQELFDALFKGYEDPDKDVRSAIIQLDRSLRETVIDSDNLDAVNIIVFLRDKIYPKSTQTRLFLINWITSLDRTGGINMVLYLPELLDGLLLMLEDPDETLVNKLKTLLDNFLAKLSENNLDKCYRQLVNILVFQIGNPNTHKIVRYTALIWLEKFIKTFKENILPFTSGILKATLPSFDENIEDDSIRDQARVVSSLMIDLFKTSDLSHSFENALDKPDTSTQEISIEDTKNLINSEIQRTEPSESPKDTIEILNKSLRPMTFQETISTLCIFSGEYSQQTKLAALEWLHTLIDVAPNQTLSQIEQVFPSMFRFAVDPSSEVISSGLLLVAKFSKKDVMSYVDKEKSNFLYVPEEIKSALLMDTNQYFLRFIYELIVYLDTNLRMLEEKGNLIIGDLCMHMGSELIFNTLAEIIQKSNELECKFQLIHKLNRILLSNPILFGFRNKLRSIRTENYCTIFKRLYRAWSYNKVALLTLTLLTQNYEHSRRVVKTFGEHEIDVDTLNEFDLLIQFIESPVFAFLRMHLLDPRYIGFLSETLYSVLMILPQSEAFKVLQNRLNCIPRKDLTGLIEYNLITAPDHSLMKKNVPFNDLLANLLKVQQSEENKKLERLQQREAGDQPRTRIMDKHLSL